MTLLAIKHPVQLLCDAKGTYGIGVVSSAVEDGHRHSPEIILRPDRLLEAKTRPAALQMIMGGFRHGMFSHMAEERLRQAVHWEMLRRKGLNWPPDDLRWWSKDSEQQARNRQIYHGLRLSSLAVINRLIGEALQAAAEPHALALARRFRFHHRYEIYRATAPSHRALQLTDVFPALGLAIFGLGSSRAKSNLIPEAKRLVEGGAPLRKVAELMGVPTAFRRVKPGAADLAWAVVDAFEDPRLIDAHMPEPLAKMKLWLNCIYLAQSVGPDFVQWTSRHATDIGSSHDEVIGILRDIADWVRACYRASVPPHIRKAILGDQMNLRAQGEQFVHRQFNPDMSLATVSKLSADWHDAVAANMTTPNTEFPEPWCPGSVSGGFDIVPITSSSDLYREGKLLHHCAGTYAERVHSGECYMFSVRKDVAPLATLELVHNEAGVAIGQLRGACNAKAPKEVLRAVNSWLRAQKEFRFPQKRPNRLLDDDDILF
jgi:PcfJ-like protein